MSTYEIALTGGKVLSGLTMNGGMFVSQEEVTKSDLSEAALKQVTITEIPEEGAPINTLIVNAVNDSILDWPEGYLFNIREKTKEEQQAAEIVSLKEENQFLVGCIMEISEEVWK